MEEDLQPETFVVLKFTTQKNGCSDKKIDQNDSGVTLLCLKASPLRCVLHLSYKKAPPSTPLARVVTQKGRWKYITPNIISKTLKTAIMFCGPNMGF